jgi:hypothetical protein
MTSQLNVDTIVDKAGTGGTNVKVANNAVAVAEGGSATTNVVQGLVKAWSQQDGATAVASDSFNVASITDEGTGDASFTYTNAMNNDNYSVVATTGYKAATSVENSIVRQITTSKGRVRNTNDSGTYRDPGVYCTSVLGDLA